jgi:hypothetical protein
MDPVGFVESNPMSFNRYLYVNNNPYKYNDPDGKFLNFVAGAVAGAVIDAAVQYSTTGEVNLGEVASAAVLGSVGLGLAQKALKLGKAAKASRAVNSLRSEYVSKVNGLSGKADKMRKAGKSSESIAKALHAERRSLGVKYKDLTPSDMLEKIYSRNIEKYGDKLGPTIDHLRNKGKTWDDIAESATRTGGKDLKP